MHQNIRRGEIWLTNLNELKNSNVQSGIRPVVIVQNDIGNKYSPTTVCIPMSTQVHKAKLPTHVLIDPNDDLNRKSFSMAEQLQTIDKSKLIKKIGKLNGLKLKEVEDSILVSLGLIQNKKRLGDGLKCVSNM